MDQSWAINPGVINAINNYVPSKRGSYLNFANGPNQNMGDPPTFTAQLLGGPITGYIFKSVSGAASSARMFVCTVPTIANYGHTRLLELTAAGVLTDRSAGAVDYAAGTTNWTMCNQGNAIIAASYANATQVSTGGAFAALGGGSPTAQCCCSNQGFVMLANYNDGVNAYHDGWWCSGLYNYATFTPSLATQAANGRLLDTPGPIQALVPLRDTIIAYKDDSIYLGQYVGDTVDGIIWGWQVISDKVGCSSPHGIAVLNNVHYFLHKTGVYAFDGTQVVSIGADVQKELLRQIGDVSLLAYAQSGVDEIEGIVYLGHSAPGTRSTTVTNILMLNVNTGKWGGSINDYTSGGVWHSASNSQPALWAFMHATLSDLVQWEAGTWEIFAGSNIGGAGGTGPICIGSDGLTTVQLRQPQYGAAVAAYFSTGLITSGWLTVGPAMSYLKRLWMRFPYFGTQQTTPQLSVLHSRQEGNLAAAPPTPPLGTAAGAVTWNANDATFDCSAKGAVDRCLQFSLAAQGPHEIAGVWAEIDTVGTE